MNNETKILAMSLLAILTNYESSKRFSSFGELDILRDFNKKIDFRKGIDSDGDEISEKIEIIKDEELQKIILQQEKEIKEKVKKQIEDIEKILKNNNEKINMVKEILLEILEKRLEKENTPF